MEYRWDTGGADAIRNGVADLVGLAPDVIVANGSVAMGPVMQLTRTLPIVFVTVADPVGQGYVNSLSRPGGNVTGFVLYEFGLAGKRLELLKEMAPQWRGGLVENRGFHGCAEKVSIHLDGPT